MPKMIGLDVGATTVKGAVVDETGYVLSRSVVSTPANESSTEIEDAIIACVDRLRADSGEVAGIGLAAAGWVSADQRTMVFSANFPAWRNEPIADRITERSGLPVVLDNDANAAAWAEFRFGAGSATHSMAAITLGSGVGGALVVNGELVRGFHGAAGEIGHSVMITGGYPCACGRHGCMENYVSGRSVNRRAKPIIGDHDLYASARSGDQRALDLYTELGGFLGRGLANLVMLVDPELIVISGGVADAFDLFAAAATAAMTAELGTHWAGLVPAFAVATLGPEAGTLGAADLAQRAFASA
jgi:glucokinase